MQNLLRKNRAIKYIFLVVGGVATCLPMVFTQIGFLQWIAMSVSAAVMLYTARDRSVKYRKIYKYGFVYFMSFYMTAKDICRGVKVGLKLA